jgi:hypothetical protein
MHVVPRPPRLRARFVLIATLVACAAALRLVPHPPNFTPVGGIALFAGAEFGSLAAALALPLLSMLASDLWMEAIGQPGIHSGMPVVYACFVVAVLLGRWGARTGAGRLPPRRIAVLALLSATLFFVATNFAVWVSSRTYPHDLRGLAACYLAALPFFRNTLAGDAVTVAGLFGALALAERRWPALRRTAST